MQRFDPRSLQVRPSLLIAVVALFCAFAAALFSLFGGNGVLDRFTHSPAPLLGVEVILPGHAQLKSEPRGATLTDDGYLTITRVPPSPAKAKPIVHDQPLPSATPAGPTLDPSVAGGIRAFFRTLPPPPDDRSVLATAEYKYTQLRLVLVKGCFRADGPTGPLLAFPPGARLFVDDTGYLNVGVLGPPDMRARVGEELFWEAYAVRISEPGALERVRALCGPGEVMQAVPSSAALLAARNDAQAATAFQRSSTGMDWTEALQSVQACDRRMEAAMRRDNARSPEIHVQNMCGSPFANPPNPGTCPPGTRFDRGNCLDAQASGRSSAGQPKSE